MDSHKKLEVLAAVTQAITSSLDLDVVLNTIVDKVVELLQCDSAAILLLDEEGEYLTIESATGLGSALVEFTKDKVGSSIAGRAVARNKTIVARDVASDKRFENPWGENEGLLSMVSVPLRLGDTTFGTLDAHSKTRVNAFDEEQINLLEMLAGQAAIVIEHARLYERLKSGRDEMADELARERSMLGAVMDSLPDLIYVKDRECRFVNGNAQLIEVMGALSLSDLVGKTDYDFYPRELAEEYYRDDRAVITTGTPLINHEEPNIDQVTGQQRWLLTSKTPLTDEHGEIIGLVGIGRDITERKMVGEALRKRNRDLRLLNDMGRRLQGCVTEEQTWEVMGSVCAELFPRESGCLRLLNEEGGVLECSSAWGGHAATDQELDRSECPALVGKISKTGVGSDEVRFCSHMDESLCGNVCAPIRTSETVLGVLHMHLAGRREEMSATEWESYIEPKLALIKRITDYYALFLVNLRLRETLRKEAIHDPLTGLYNRRHMEAYLEREEHRYKRYGFGLSVILMDIDHFKRVNDTYGHDVGDEVLAAVGDYLMTNVRGEDIACRFGGEEFLVIMSGVSRMDAEKRAEQMRKEIQALSVDTSEGNLQVTMSFGVAALPENGYSIREVFTAADKALYKAKTNGRNRVEVA